METNKNILPEFWEFIENKRTKTPLWERIYQWLNRDNLNAIIVDRGVFWTELTSSEAHMPVYVRLAIKNWCKLQGYQYLYDLK